MSRIGKVPIDIPKGVTVDLKDRTIKVKGPKGTLAQSYNDRVEIKKEGDQIKVERVNDERFSRASHGLYQRLVENMIKGVTQGYKKELEIVGVGYRAELKGKELAIQAGLSHEPHYPIPDGITITVPKPNQVIIEGIDKQKVGQVAAEIRKIRPPEPYKGKGIRYADEHVRRKVGKAGAK